MRRWRYLPQVYPLVPPLAFLFVRHFVIFLKGAFIIDNQYCSA